LAITPTNPLTSDVPGIAAMASDWVRVATGADSLPKDGAEAVAESMAGLAANPIVPANFAWTEAPSGPAAPIAPAAKSASAQADIDSAAAMLKSGEVSCLFLGAGALREEGLALAHRIAVATGARVICEVFPARLQRGIGRFAPERLPYLGEMAVDHINDVKNMILISAKAPVSFFAYPDKPGKL
jgi:acetolactate synthase-1/2/3 large subunit